MATVMWTCYLLTADHSARHNIGETSVCLSWKCCLSPAVLKDYSCNEPSLTWRNLWKLCCFLITKFLRYCCKRAARNFSSTWYIIVWNTVLLNFVNFYRLIPKFYDNNLGVQVGSDCSCCCYYLVFCLSGLLFQRSQQIRPGPINVIKAPAPMKSQPYGAMDIKLLLLLLLFIIFFRFF